MCQDQNLVSVLVYIKKERIKVKNVILKNISDKADKFDPFENENCFYIYNIEIEKTVISQLIYLLKPNQNKEQKTTFFNNSNIIDFPILKNIKEQILNILKKHSLQLGNNWAQLYNKNNYHPIHVHTGSKYSGIIYIDGKNASPTTFYSKSFKEYNHLFKQNTLILFPSWIPHQVKKLKKDEERLIISFNAN